MKELNGIVCKKNQKYCLIYINEFTEDIKAALRNWLAIICHGEDYVKSGRQMYSYESTIKEFLKRYKEKSSEIQIGMIGELLIHLILTHYFDEFKVVTPYFNMEERSIKKGYDVVLTEKNVPSIWLIEVKSGELHKDKDVNQTMNDLLNIAKSDLKKRLNEENVSLWHEAINGAKIAFDSCDSMKDAVLNVLMDWGDEAYLGNNTSKNKNVIISGVVFAYLDDLLKEDVVKNKQHMMGKGDLFEKTYVIAMQKGTCEKVYQFLKDEVEYDKQ